MVLEELLGLVPQGGDVVVGLGPGGGAGVGVGVVGGWAA